MTDTKQHIYKVLEQVPDPEIPVLTIQDLGVIREVIVNEDGVVEIIITPTYSGCPAMDMIEVNIKAALQEAGYARVKVCTVLSPAWTTDWISKEARAKLKAYGIAPPQGTASKSELLGLDIQVECPLCGSLNTELLSQFGSTACKSLYRCKECLEPFDYFKCH
ncbi:MAG TPA: phenylacetate-CoA oxygenase subunit PaaJ [Phaeodactylibacter sp.]|nr:phenylacetate-CoA oxygenase subunit PaaJ [Phaeodactylibacter sp.]